MFIKTILAEGFSKIASRAECSISFQGKVIFVSINDDSIIVFRLSFFVQTIMNKTIFICF